MGEPTVAQSSLSISTSAAEVRSVFELFQEDDFYAQFLERGFDSSRFAGAILTQDMATSTTGSDSKRRADPSDLPHQKRLGAQEAVIKIEAGVKQLDDELSKQVVAHHEELLHQVADVRELERVLEHVRDGVNALEDGVSALQLSVREPYSQLAASVGELERVQAVTDLLRRTFRYLSLAARLRELVQEKNTGTRYLPQAAICLRDIHDLEGEQEQEDDELMQVEVVAEQLEFVRQVYTNTINTASHLLNQGLSAHNQTDVATALQVFHNLGVLKARTYQCMADLVLHARHAIQSSLTHACFRDAEFAREVAGSRGQQTAEIRRREAVWAQLSRIADDLFACVLRGWTLQRVLSKMRDPTTHQPLVAPLSQAGALAAPFNTGSSAVTGATRSKDHLQPSHGGQSLQEDYQNVASLNPAREAASLLVQRFWAPLCEAFSGELGKVSRANPALAALLGATGYPRLLALFSARLLQRLTEQRRQVQAEQATQERVLLLRALSSFESAFLAAAQRAIRIPLAALISDAAPSPNTIADAPTEQQVAALLHAIGVQLGAVRAVDSDLCTLVAQQAVHAVQQFTVHAERMVASAPADHQTVDALTPAQLRNAHLFNALAQLRRGLLAEADRLPSISAAAYSSTASSPASVSIASTTGTTSTTSALSSSVIGADQLTRTAGSKVNTLSSSSSSSSPSSSSSSKQVASSTAPSGAPQRRDAASLLRNCAAVLASLAQQITGPLFICMSSVAHRTLLKMHSELCADTDSQQQQQQQQQSEEEETLSIDDQLPSMYDTFVPQRAEGSPVGEEDEGGLSLLLACLCTTLRDIRSPRIKRIALHILEEFAKRLDNESRLQRIVPYVVTMFTDPDALVRATAIGTVTQVLKLVEKFPLSDTNVVQEYILPALLSCRRDENDIVRQAFAKHLAQLADIARWFLETSQRYRSNEVSTSEKSAPRQLQQTSYDKELAKLQDTFCEILVDMFPKDRSTAVKKTLLVDITRLCIFFGHKRTNDFLLPLIITFLNDGDWELRSAFFEHILGVCAVVGTNSLEQFILPCLMQALTDEEEFVVHKVVHCLASLCELSLFRQHVLLDVATRTAPLLVHPNSWLRMGAIALQAAVGEQLSPSESFCFLRPIVTPFLTGEVLTVTEDNLLRALRSPLSRAVYTRAVDLSPRYWASTIDGTSRKESFEEFLLKSVENVSTISLDDAQKTSLTLLTPYIGNFSRVTHSKSKQEGRTLEEDANILHEYSTLASTITVRELVIPDAEEEELTAMLSSAAAQGSKTDQVMYSPEVVAVRREWEKYFPPESGQAQTLPTHCRPLPRMPPLGSLFSPDGTSSPVDDSSLKGWRPKGILVANLHEHKASVNEIQVSRDNQFFATASDDGTVKIWDCQRLEKSVTNRSRLTYSAQGGRISSIAILENSHSIVSGSDNGSLHVYRVDLMPATRKDTTSLTSYNGVTALKRLADRDGAVLSVEAYNTNGGESMIVYSTSKGQIHGWDLRCQREAWVMNNESSSGRIQTFVLEPTGKTWLLAGTSRGYYTCWDVRFNLPVKTWRQPGGGKISKLLHYGSRRGQSWVYSAVGPNQVWLWDVEGSSCKQLFRTLPSNEHVPLPRLAVEDETLGLPSPSIPSANDTQLIESALLRPSIRALHSPQDCPFLLTGGSDRQIRYWDLADAAHSYVLSGMEPDQLRPRYRSHAHEGATIFEELPSSDANEAVVQMQRSARTQTRGPVSVNHNDCVLDIKTIQAPSRMLISASRDGIVKVFQ